VPAVAFAEDDIRWGFRDREELIVAGAKELIATPADLLRPIANHQ